MRKKLKIGLQAILRITQLPEDRLLFDSDYSRALRARDARIVHEKSNMLVNTGLSVCSRMLGGNAGAPTLYGGFAFKDIDDLVVTRMELGDKVSPPTPAENNLTGVLALVYVPTLVVTYPDAYTIKFSGLLPLTEANGKTLTEEALRLRNGSVFAKTTFSKLKNSSFALQFDHWFTFVRV